MHSTTHRVELPHPLVALLILLLSILLSWIIALVPVWLSSKLFSASSTFGKATVATLLSVILFILIDALVSRVSQPLALLLGLLSIVWLFKVIFDVGWGKAFGIAVVSFVMTVIILVILAAVGLGLSFLLS